jgi:uncharacterized protein Smg (DUF494 family)
MHEHIVEIIIYLMSELRNNHAINERTVHTLSKRGYSQTEISTAFSWVADRTSMRDFVSTALEGHPLSFRVLHEFEKMFISPEVLGYFVQLTQLGVISHDQREEIIDRCIISGLQPIDIAEAKKIVAEVLFSSATYTTPGRRIFLQPTDLIH